MSNWRTVLELNANRDLVSGSETALAKAIGRGADLRVYTEFRYNEHVDVASPNSEIMREVSEFGVTYLLDERWAAGIMNLRQPIEPPNGFGSRPSLSFFLYNQNGQQAIARPYLDGRDAHGVLGAAKPQAPINMPRYHAQQSYDAGTNAPSGNFIYDFECYRFLVEDSWHEVFSHDENGAVAAGSIGELAAAFSQGCDLKVAVRGLCSDMTTGDARLEHELFVKVGYSYFNTEQKIFTAGTQPIVRVRPAVPLLYASGNWDFGWLMARSDGFVQYRRCDPYTLNFEDKNYRCALRWLVRA
jgi:hypothetical protein